MWWKVLPFYCFFTTLVLLLVVVFGAFPCSWVFFYAIWTGFIVVTVGSEILREAYHTDKTFRGFYEDYPIGRNWWLIRSSTKKESLCGSLFFGCWLEEQSLKNWGFCQPWQSCRYHGIDKSCNPCSNSGFLIQWKLWGVSWKRLPQNIFFLDLLFFLIYCFRTTRSIFMEAWCQDQIL